MISSEFAPSAVKQSVLLVRKVSRKLRRGLAPGIVVAFICNGLGAEVFLRPLLSTWQSEVYILHGLCGSATTCGASTGDATGSLELLDFGSDGSDGSLLAGGAVLDSLQQVGYLGLDVGKLGSVVGQSVDDRLDGSELVAAFGDGSLDRLEQRQLVGERAVDIAPTPPRWQRAG